MPQNSALLDAAPPRSGVRVLAPRAYDAIKLMANEYGGIGYGLMYEDENHSDSAPLDSQGLLERGLGYPAFKEASKEAHAYLRAAGLHDADEMKAVRRIIARKGIPDGPRDPWPRVSFNDWCVELEIVRGRE